MVAEFRLVVPSVDRDRAVAEWTAQRLGFTGAGALVHDVRLESSPSVCRRSRGLAQSCKSYSPEVILRAGGIAIKWAAKNLCLLAV